MLTTLGSRVQGGGGLLGFAAPSLYPIPSPLTPTFYDALRHQVAHLPRAHEQISAGLPDIGSPVPFCQHLAYRCFDSRRRRLVAKRVAEQHGGREDGGKGIGLLLPGDVGSGAMDRLVEGGPISQAC